MARLRELYPPGTENTQIAADLRKRGIKINIGRLSTWDNDRRHPSTKNISDIARAKGKPAQFFYEPVQPHPQKEVAAESGRATTTGEGVHDSSVTRPVAAPEQTAESRARDSTDSTRTAPRLPMEALVSHYHDNPLVLAAMAISARQGVTKDVLTSLADALDSEWEKRRRGLHPGNAHSAPS